MKAEAHDIDAGELTHLLTTHYGLELSSLRFLPKGEDAYGYVAEAHGKPKYFVRLQGQVNSAAFDTALRLARWIRKNHEIPEIVAAIPALDGSLTTLYVAYQVSVFPFVNGRTGWESGISDSQLATAAQALARLHVSDASGLSQLTAERFDNPFRPTIRRLLTAAADNARLVAGTAMERAQCLFAEETGRLSEALDDFDRRGQKLRLLNLEMVVTHGDPNLDNWIIGSDGSVHLVDWGELALGPLARDLFAFIGERLPVFLEAYRSVNANLYFHLDALQFYFYRWAFQEIADYGTRLLTDDTGAIEKEHAWAELQHYLPVRHKSIADDLERARCIAIETLGSSRVS